MEFEEACSEMDYILENMNPIDKEKIPQKVIKFFKDNKSIFYKVKLDSTKNLSQQELKEETKAFIKIINYNYFMGQDGKEELKEILKEDVILEENINQTEDNSLVIYKENKMIEGFRKLIRKIKIYIKKL